MTKAGNRPSPPPAHLHYAASTASIHGCCSRPPLQHHLQSPIYSRPVYASSQSPHGLDTGPSSGWPVIHTRRLSSLHTTHPRTHPYIVARNSILKAGSILIHTLCYQPHTLIPGCVVLRSADYTANAAKKYSSINRRLRMSERP
jgi:hypothetical protein